MAVSTTNAISGPFTTNGVTVTFPFTFTAPSESEVAVFLRENDTDTAVSTSLYSVTLGASGGGSVTFTTAPATGSDLYITLEPSFTQDIQFEDGSAWLASPVNNANDRAAARDQYLKRDLDRAFKFPFGEVGQSLPATSLRIGKYLGFDASGNVAILSGTGADAGLRDDLAGSNGFSYIGGPISGSRSFVTSGGRVGITDQGASFSPEGILEVRNRGTGTKGSAGVGLLVQSWFEGSTATPFTNHDNTLFVAWNKVLSNSTNQSWAVSAANAYQDIPAGVTDTGIRYGVLGWATSVSQTGYTHAGTLDLQFGVVGRAGFQGVSPATAVITEAVGVAGEILADSPGSTITTAKAGMFSSNGLGLDNTPGTASTIGTNIAVGASAQNGTVGNYSFYGFFGQILNESDIISLTTFFGRVQLTETDAAFAARCGGTYPLTNAFEFGYQNPSTLGATFETGYPYLALCAESDPTGNTFRTRGNPGVVVWTDLSGDLIFSRVTNAIAAGQILTETCRFDQDGRLIFPLPTYADNATAVAGGLNTHTFYKTATGEVRTVV